MADPVAALKQMGIQGAQLQSLRGFLDGSAFKVKVVCDHTHARTEEWAGRMGVDMEALVENLKALGGTCDCKVLQVATAETLG
jgi:hypothetical protein